MSTVHILNQDIRPLCRFTDKQPDAWPTRHTWVWLTTFRRVVHGADNTRLCPFCKAAAQQQDPRQPSPGRGVG